MVGSRAGDAAAESNQMPATTCIAGKCRETLAWSDIDSSCSRYDCVCDSSLFKSWIPSYRNLSFVPPVPLCSSHPSMTSHGRHIVTLPTQLYFPARISPRRVIVSAARSSSPVGQITKKQRKQRQMFAIAPRWKACLQQDHQHRLPSVT